MCLEEPLLNKFDNVDERHVESMNPIVSQPKKKRNETSFET